MSNLVKHAHRELELMLECGAGDVTREVLAAEILGVPPSWEKQQ